MEGESPRSSSSDRSGPGSSGSSSPIHGFVEAFGTALTSTAAASATAAIAAGRRLSPGGGKVRGERFEDMMTARLDDLARMVGEVADRVLKYVSDRMPGLEACAISTMDTIFAPRLVLRHLMVAVALQAGLLTYNGLVAAANELLSRMSKRHGEARIFREKMRDAKNYEEWKMHAEQLDHLEGHDEWRKRPDSLLYNHKVLQEKINDLNTMINAEDVFGLIFRLRGSLSRNQHGMLHEGLFTRAHAGTKVLVEQYHGVVCDALHYVCTKNAMAQDIPTDVKLAFFNETRHAYGRTALMLSGGASMGVYHAGVIKALWERRLLPRVVSGASAGSIVAAMVGTRTDAELDPMFNGKDVNLNFFCPLRSSTRRGGRRTSKVKNQAFWQLLVPPGLRWMATRLSNVLLYHDGFLRMDSDYFRRVVRYNVGPSTFQEAFDRTGRIVNITVAPQNRTDPPRLLNYLTAPHVLVWSAAVCSSSVPGVFEPSYLLVKDADGSIHPEYETIEKFVDGSMEADLPMQQISELFNINHFIVSQANPHASILSTMALSKSVWCPPMYGFLVGLVGFLQAQVRCWFRNVIEFISRRRVAPEWASKRGGIQLLTQEYEGRHCDVTISPWKGKENVVSSFAKLLRNVSTTEFLVMTRVAERNTWPKMEMIRSHCAVEMELEQCVQAMRRQLTTEHQARIHPSSEDMKRYGRVPSFYTSRSLVNLSGLSVTDPSIARNSSSLAQGDGSFATIGAPSNRVSLRLQKDVHHGTSADRGSARYVRENIVPAFGGMVNADIANGDSANDGITSGNIANGHGSVETQGPGGSQGFTGERRGFNFRALPPLFSQSPPVSGGSLEQSQHQQRAAAGSVAAESSDDARLDNSSGNVDLGLLSPEQLVALGMAREEDVVKSTTMANFYYRRSRSLENEMNILRQINCSSGNLSSRSEPCSRSDSRCESAHRGDDEDASPGPSAS